MKKNLLIIIGITIVAIITISVIKNKGDENLESFETIKNDNSNILDEDDTEETPRLTFSVSKSPIPTSSPAPTIKLKLPSSTYHENEILEDSFQDLTDSIRNSMINDSFNNYDSFDSFNSYDSYNDGW